MSDFVNEKESEVQEGKGEAGSVGQRNTVRRRTSDVGGRGERGDSRRAGQGRRSAILLKVTRSQLRRQR